MFLLTKRHERTCKNALAINEEKRCRAIKSKNLYDGYVGRKRRQCEKTKMLCVGEADQASADKRMPHHEENFFESN
jgi:hypothetical protein